MTKKYSLPKEESSSTVNEPQAVYSLNTEIQSPCQYSLEELNSRLDKAEEEARLGLGITTEELRKKHPRWSIL